MDFCYFIGIDIAKDTLDWAVYTQQGLQLSTHTPNTLAGIKTALVEFKILLGWNPKQAVFCMEHTCIYNAHLLESLHELKLAVWLESSLQIKQDGGMQRGKTDKVDAQRIAPYAYRFHDQIRLWEPPREVIQRLAFLSATRQRLTQAYNLLSVPVTEQETFISKSLQKNLKGNVEKSLAALKAERKFVEEQIKELIEADLRLKELFALMVSVPGIGPVIATELLITTNEMQTINDPKKLACHAGVAPFEYRSGSSIRGKTRVSHQARKRLRSLIHMGAMSAIQMKGDLQDYYVRKLTEGKHTMLVLNAVRNKLIHRVCAVVRRGGKYDKNYAPTLA
ncbi:IS110 family transposase [Spirosoma utsteinense]|uniref:Transposase n=1 Tax=Spirosoma utsteinense TaxID=2585773 RepID=A0ABR6WES2_9BACT|nr:IS110 family transposase [Spirosoma utsteinense]MBC3787155.1 transposase [Spirosoma utsteinense]MBC3795044.1 transposase [Spirosoma utsteinense]